MKADRLVYLHRRISDNRIFYVGMGTSKRAYDFWQRNRRWEEQSKEYGVYVEIVKGGLTKQEALDLERELIDKYRKEDTLGIMCNISGGGTRANEQGDYQTVAVVIDGKRYEGIKVAEDSTGIESNTIIKRCHSPNYNYYRLDDMYDDPVDSVNKVELLQGEMLKDVPEYDGLYKYSNQGRMISYKWGKEKLLKIGSNDSYTLSSEYKRRVYSIKKLNKLLWQ